MEQRRLEFPPYVLWETRAGQGTPVVLLHGLSGSTRWWSKNFDALAEKHLVAAAEVRHASADVTSLLARWIETFGEPVHLVGHSMGGGAAIRLAAARPDLVRSLLLVNSVGMPFRLAPLAHARALPKPPYGGPTIARVLVPDFVRTGPAAVAVATTRVLLTDLRREMRTLRVPTLLVWGANDPLVPLRYGEAMAREIHGAKLAVIERAAHVAMWDAPEEFNSVALSFFSSVESLPRVASPPAFSWGLSGWTNGIAHRAAGTRREVVLVHGLGMSSAYLAPLATALFARGLHPIAPDLPGFGESADGPPLGPAAHAALLASWADALGIRDAAWLGHSIGCNAVAHLATLRPDLVRFSFYVGPLWSPRAHHFVRLVVDAFREPLSLYRFVIPAYWRCGLARWLLTWFRYLADVRSAPPTQGTFIAGSRDPLPDMPVERVAGAHACVYEEGEATGEVVWRVMRAR